MSLWVPIASGDLSAEIDPMGAQLSALRDRAGRDLLWNGDPSVWAGRAPILFPIVGALAGGSYRLGPKVYSLPRHGFARGKLFEIIESSSSAASFRLRADEESLKVYPFRFELDVHFVLHDATLTVTTLVRNLGEDGMPASFGYHPAFRWPLPYGRARSSHYMEFVKDEPAPVRRLDKDGLLRPQRYATPIIARRLALADSLFQSDALIFDEIRSRSVTYGADDEPKLRVSFPDAPFLGVWTKPSANFICIEHWHGIADLTGFSGDFTAKTGVFIVAAGAGLPIRMAITLLGDNRNRACL
jgi:galactose mutarotase-like enzyme